MADYSKFDDIQTALLGTTVIPQPRVSRETIISVLQSHTDLIKGLKEDQQRMRDHIVKVEAESSENAKQLVAMAEENNKIRQNIDVLHRLSNEFRTEMDELGEKVAELGVMKKQMTEQKDFIESLAARFNKFSGDVNEFISDAGRTLSTVQESCDKTQFQLTELKDYVDHFADNLLLSAKQVTVEAETGFAPKPITLAEALTLCHKNFSDVEQGQQEMDAQLTKLQSECDAKAPDSIVFNVNTLEKKVGTIELHLQKEEEQGVGAIRKTCDELSVHVQAINVELAEKIDRDSVGFIVHEKYEEIVRYLQDALQSSLEDENKFKQKADEIQEMVILLTNSKADRTEIQHMQELMVKSEALLKKVGSQFNIKDRLKEFVSRREMDLALHTKVDKMEMDKQLQAVLASSKRNRKLSSLSENSNGHSSSGVVEDALSRQQLPVVGSSSSEQQLMMQQQRPLSASNLQSELYPHQQGSALLSRSQKTPSGEVAVIAIGQGINSSSGNSSPGAGLRGSKGDFSSYLKNKPKHPGATPTLPIATQPGQFRNGSEAGKAGAATATTATTAGAATAGSVAGGVGTSKAGDGYGRSEYPFVPPNYPLDYAAQSTVTDHMAYLNGPVVGGGFNTHAKHIQHATPGDSRPLLQDDIEGKGLMLKGTDGNLYYQDLKREQLGIREAKK